MSQENVEIMRRAYEAWNAGHMHVIHETFDPDVIARSPEGWPEPGPFVGRESVMRWWDQVREAWDADTLEPIGDFLHHGDRVAIHQIWHGAGFRPYGVERTAAAVRIAAS